MPFAFVGKMPVQRSGWESRWWTPGRRRWVVQTEPRWWFRYRCVPCIPACTHSWAPRSQAHIYHTGIWHGHMQSDDETPHHLHPEVWWQGQTCRNSGEKHMQTAQTINLFQPQNHLVTTTLWSVWKDVPPPTNLYSRPMFLKSRPQDSPPRMFQMPPNILNPQRSWIRCFNENRYASRWI